jgi:hypothetical protein
LHHMSGVMATAARDALQFLHSLGHSGGVASSNHAPNSLPNQSSIETTGGTASARAESTMLNRMVAMEEARQRERRFWAAQPKPKEPQVGGGTAAQRAQKAHYVPVQGKFNRGRAATVTPV